MAGLALFKFIIPDGEPRFLPAPESAETWKWEGVMAIALAHSVEEARALICASTPYDAAWVVHVEPERIELNDARTIAWARA